MFELIVCVKYNVSRTSNREDMCPVSLVFAPTDLPCGCRGIPPFPHHKGEWPIRQRCRVLATAQNDVVCGAVHAFRAQWHNHNTC